MSIQENMLIKELLDFSRNLDKRGESSEADKIRMLIEFYKEEKEKNNEYIKALEDLLKNIL